MRATLIFILILASGCVSVTLGNSSAAKRAHGVTVKDPGKPFIKESRHDVDAAWKNPDNGNVISYLSDCKDPSDPSLEAIVDGILAGLADLEIQSQERVTFLHREGRRVLAFGKVDGVHSGIDLLVFKRNHCIFILTYVGVKSSFPTNRDEFSRFINGFNAP